MKKALLSLVCAVCAPLAMTATPGVNYRYAPQPGKSTMVTTVDKTGKISYELKSTPETPAQRSAKTRMMAEAKNTYTLTVKAGDDAKVFGIWVIKDHVTNWESMLKSEATFTLPAGKYLVQTVYSTTPCVDLFQEVNLTSDMEINMSTSDADKTASIGLYMPNGEKATFPVLDPETYEETDTPHNCDSFVITASADYKGLYACNHQLMGFGGFASEEYIEQAALATNVTDGTMMWICSYDNSQQYMASFVAKDAATVTDGDVYWNDPSEFRKYDVAFERTPAYATGGGNDGVDANFNIVGPNGIWYGGLGLTSAAPLDVYVNTPVYDPASFNLLMTIGDLDYYDADNWVTQGVTSAPLARTADGIMLMSENYIGSATPMGNTFYYAPAFEMPLQSGMKMGASAPVAITYSDYISWVDKPYYETSILTHIGYYGENRVIDGNSTTVAVDFNGEPIDFSKYDYDFGLWQEQWGTDGHTPRVWPASSSPLQPRPMSRLAAATSIPVLKSSTTLPAYFIPIPRPRPWLRLRLTAPNCLPSCLLRRASVSSSCPDLAWCGTAIPPNQRYRRVPTDGLMPASPSRIWPETYTGRLSHRQCISPSSSEKPASTMLWGRLLTIA